MTYCKKCGAEISEGTLFCPRCGEPVNEQAPVQDFRTYSAPEQPAAPDSGSFGWGVLGFCIPLVGLILFLVWKDNKPKTAKMAGKGALISVIISVIFYIISFVVGIGGAMMY